MRKRLLRVQEVAGILDINISRVYEMIRQGILPAVRMGRQVRIDQDALDEFIKNGGKGFSGGWKRNVN